MVIDIFLLDSQPESLLGWSLKKHCCKLSQQCVVISE
jgi:hypothetical protein